MWLTQFVISPIPEGPGFWGFLSKWVDEGVTAAYFAWAGWEIVRMAVGRRAPEAVKLFGVMWKRHVV